jgi:hypothetical protein
MLRFPSREIEGFAIGVGEIRIFLMNPVRVLNPIFEEKLSIITSNI